MNRRDFVTRTLGVAAGAATLATVPAAAAGPKPRGSRCEPLAGDYSVLWKASDPLHEIGYCPALARLSGGRLIGCMLHAGADSKMQRQWTVKVYTSDDRGCKARRAALPQAVQHALPGAPPARVALFEELHRLGRLYPTAESPVSAGRNAAEVSSHGSFVPAMFV